MPLLRFGGAGTQRIERELAQKFPKARVLAARHRRARRPRRAAKISEGVRASGEADIPLGTQMIAKGLDTNVTLVWR